MAVLPLAAAVNRRGRDWLECATSRHWTIAGNLALLAEHIVPALSEQSVEPASDHELPVSDYGYKLDFNISSC